MQIVYLGGGKARELSEMRAPLVQDFHDPGHFELHKEIYIDYINALRTFDVSFELAARLQTGQVYDDTVFKLTLILTTL